MAFTKQCLAGMFLFLLSVTVSTTVSAEQIGRAEAVVGAVYGQSVDKKMAIGEAIQFRQKVRTGVDGAANLRFIDQSTLSVGPRTQLTIDTFVYNPDQSIGTGLLRLARGLMRFVSNQKFKEFKVETPVGTIGIRGTVFDAWASDRSLEIAVHQGEIAFSSSRQTKVEVVKAGEVLSVNSAGQTTKSQRPSTAFTRQVGTLIALLQNTASPLTPRALYAAQSRRLIMALADGEVVIELLPDLAPRHVARITTLVQEKFYDGLAFFDVQADFAAITGDPNGDGTGGSGQSLAAEFSSSPFTTGSVGMIYSPGKPNSADSQFFIALTDLPHLNGKYTKWGRIVTGMEHIKALAQGRPPRTPTHILTLRLQ